MINWGYYVDPLYRSTLNNALGGLTYQNAFDTSITSTSTENFDTSGMRTNNQKPNSVGHTEGSNIKNQNKSQLQQKLSLQSMDKTNNAKHKLHDGDRH